MMFEVEVAGRTRTVSIERAGKSAGTYRVVVDGRPHLVNAVRIADYGLSLLGTVTFFAGSGTGFSPDDLFSGHISPAEKVPVPNSGGEVGEKVPVPEGAGKKGPVLSREVQVTPVGRTGQVLVSFEGRLVAATINGRRSGRAAHDAGPGAHGEQTVVAPMPGRVVRVLVAPGDEIAARQGVVVIEAMKMENELRSPKAGRVKDVTVRPGIAVEAGKVLVVIE